MRRIKQALLIIYSGASFITPFSVFDKLSFWTTHQISQSSLAFELMYCSVYRTRFINLFGADSKVSEASGHFLSRTSSKLLRHFSQIHIMINFISELVIGPNH